MVFLLYVPLDAADYQKQLRRLSELFINEINLILKMKNKDEQTKQCLQICFQEFLSQLEGDEVEIPEKTSEGLGRCVNFLSLQAYRQEY